MNARLTLLILFGSFPWKLLTSQIVGEEAFLQGNYVEAGVSGCGCYITQDDPPVGYHPTGIDTGHGFGLVADEAMDGWDVGTPPYFGDFVKPGTPVEGFDIQINGSYFVNTDQSCSGFLVPGGITSYTHTASTVTATWDGMIDADNLSIHQVSILRVNAMYLLTALTFTNEGASPLEDIYYMRNIDPDNEQTWTGDFATNNAVVSDPPESGDALVTATGLAYGGFLGMGSRNFYARASRGNFTTAGYTPYDAYYGLDGYFLSGSMVLDAAIQTTFYIGTLDPGESKTVAFAYIFSPDAVEEALNATALLGPSCGAVYDADTTGVTTTTASVNWTPIPGADSYLFRYRPAAGGPWTTLTVPTPPVDLSGLTSCTDYNYAIVTECAGILSDITYGSFSTTCGDCEAAPFGVYVDSIAPTSAMVHWDPVEGAVLYNVNYVSVPGGSLTTVNTPFTEKFLGGLSPSTNYKIRIRAQCGAGFHGPYSVFVSFMTPPLRYADDSPENGIAVYPNPSGGNFNLILPQAGGDYTIRIVNALGEVVYTEFLQLGKEETEISLGPDLPQGIYIITVQNGINIWKNKIVVN